MNERLLRVLVLDKTDKGLSAKEIAKEIRESEETVQKIIDSFAGKQIKEDRDGREL